MKQNVKKIIAIILMSFMAVSLVFSGTSKVKAAGSTFINGSFGQTEMNQDGLQLGTWLTANGERSNYDSVPATIGFLNMDPAVTSLTQMAHYKNTTNSDMKINLFVTLPKVYSDDLAVFSGDALTPPEGITYKYSYVAGKYGDFDATNKAGLMIVQVQGTLKPNQEGTLSLPLTIPSYTAADKGAKLETTIINYTNGVTTSTLHTYLTTTGDPELDFKNYDKPYLAVLRNDDGSYDNASQAIQDLMPVQNASKEITYDNFGVGFGKVDDPDFLIGGHVYIQLDPIKAAVGHDGYSVAVNSTTDQLMDHYSYIYGSISTGGVNLGLEQKQLYVEVRQVIDTTNYTIDEGKTWDIPWDKTKNVKIYDHNKNLVDVNSADIKITGDVDITKSGQYPVTYTYLPDNVSKTQIVTIKGAESSVIVKYLDDQGNPIADQEEMTGHAGDSYKTQQKTIDGYTFKEAKGNVTGTYGVDDQTVEYIYTKDIPSTPLVPATPAPEKPAPSQPGTQTPAKPDKPSKNQPNNKQDKDKVLPQTDEGDTSVVTVVGMTLLVALIAISVIFKRRKQ